MIKKLIKSIREYKIYAILTPLLVMGEVVMEVLIPKTMADLIDKGVYLQDMSNIYKYGLILVIMSFLALFFGISAGLASAKASSGFAKNLRKDLYYKIQDFSFSNTDKFKTSSLITRLTTDVGYVQRAFQVLTRMAIRSPLMMIFSLFMALRVNKSLSLIFLITIPFLAVGLFLIIKTVHPIMTKTFKKYDDLNNVTKENVNAIRVIKSYNLEQEEIHKFNKSSDDIRDNFIKAEKILALNSPLLQGAIYVSILFIGWFGAKIIVNSNMTELTTGSLMTLFTYTTQILFSMMILSMVLVMLTISRASAERIVEVLSEESNITSPDNPIRKLEDGSIEFKNVGFSYISNLDKEVLKDINLKINSGETIGIIGGTGSGKSTFVNLIPRLYDVTEGEIIVGGHNVKEYDLKVLRDNVSCVLQKNTLFSGSIIDNIRWGNKKASLEEIKEVCKMAHIDDFIESLPEKYDYHIEQGGTNVSGGQRQRLCIARALIKKPKILILDDSTSAVDTKTDKLIRETFKESIPNTTKIIISARISSVMDADRILVLDNGRLDAFDTHENLLKKNKIYHEIYNSQIKGSDTNEKA